LEENSDSKFDDIVQKARDSNVFFEKLGNFENPENKEADQDGLQGDLDFTERRSFVEKMKFGTNNNVKVIADYGK
jgi:hypothetical protein